MKKVAFAIITVLMMIPILSACTKGAAVNDKTEHVLRIASSYGIDEEYFRQQYTELFEYANEKIKVEIIPTMDNNMRYGNFNGNDPNAAQPKDPLDKLTELMEGSNPPDVVILGFEQLSTLVSKNLLAPLDPQIKKYKFDTTDIVPLVLDTLKNVSQDGKLYALSPTFNSSALIYNKQMFADAGVEPPKDNMTWDEVFDLGRRVAKGEGKDRKYGFSFSPQSQGDLYYSIQPYITPLQLRTFDEQGEKMVVDNDKWEKVLTTMLQLQKDQVIPPKQDMSNMNGKMAVREGDVQNPFAYDDFMSGRVAMTLMDYGQLSQIINANKNADNIKGYTKIDWDVVTTPSHPEAPGVVANVGLNNLMAINAKSTNLADAWKFIEFSNSEKWAQLKSHSNYQIVSRKKYIKPKEGADFHVEAFYNVKGTPQTNDSKLYREKPSIGMVSDIGRTEFQ
ncbi:MAG: transporter substrate-binding protein, partial [Bacilli bacterium]|nr:transporter substrate-binding protein [Bacilli bacterium]